MSEHAIKEYLKTLGSGNGGVSQETDPVFTASPAHGISSQDITDWNNKSDFSGDYDDLTNKPTIPSIPSDIGAQDELVSGTNIKTINGNSVLGSGDLQVGGSGTPTPTANEVAEFDSSAKMNSTDMTSAQVDDFVDGLNVSGGGVETSTLTISKGTADANYCKRIGNIVFFYVEIKSITWASGWNTLAKLPSGYIPSVYFDFAGIDNSTDTACHVKVTASGDVQVYKTASIGSAVRLSCMFIV